jgi:hypothetical protein
LSAWEILNALNELTIVATAGEITPDASKSVTGH